MTGCGSFPSYHSSDTVRHHSLVTRAMREEQNANRSLVVWFTGLSGSGKSTIAHAVEARLYAQGCRTFVLDGDNVRHGLCGDLGFSDQDRIENLRRIGEVAKLFVESGTIALTAMISPFRDDRRKVRLLLGEENFIEVYCCCPLEVCEERDVKGLYKKARAGIIKNYTGISSPYEEPLTPELVLETAKLSLEDSVEAVLDCVLPRIDYKSS